MKLQTYLFFQIVLLGIPSISYGYVGPGAGLSAIGSVLALLGSVFLLIVGFLWYPIKRLIKRKPTAGSSSGDDSKIQ